jgi:sterol desaturase/sphingolipid hydroxylase (fatty acid hydroxylase superfamily)
VDVVFTPSAPYISLVTRVAVYQSRRRVRRTWDSMEASKSSSTSSTRSTKVVAKKETYSFLEGLAGTRNGSFFTAPSWVNLHKAPGHTSQNESYGNNPDWCALLSGKFLFFSPNLIWLLAAIVVYFIFPYPYNDIPVAATFAMDWIGYRALVNCTAVLSFFGFWHVTLYFMEYGQRPFKQDRVYRASKVVHNIYYSILGALQWTLWEVIVLHCYATKRLGFVSDHESFNSWSGIMKFVAWFFLVPLWREVHFYFAHRLIHNKVLYKYCHSLHHRNTDIEPFSGLCMHPIEHLYYFSCIGPALYVHATPFGFLWNGIHLLLSPAASHSGYEDNWQSDQFHYLHHRYFECNYGTPTFPFDRLFGTFRDQLVEGKDSDSNTPSTYKGSADVVSSKVAMNSDAKATLYGLPKWDQQMFNIVACIIVPGLVYMCKLNLYDYTVSTFDVRFGEVASFTGASVLAFMVALGPVFVAGVLLWCTASSRQRQTGFRKLWLYPFHKEHLLGGYGFNVLVSTLIAVLPTYTLVHMFLSSPGESHYYTVQGMFASE